MIDRRKVAPVLLVLGAGLAVVGSFSGTYRTLYPGYGAPQQTFTTTLWIVTAEPPSGGPDSPYNAAGWPVLVAAVAMVVAAVLLGRARTAYVGGLVAMGFAGGLAGTVVLYVLQVLREEAVMESWPVEDGQRPELSFLGGMYLLVVAAVVGLVGAVLAQRKQQPEEELVDEDAVVVHQLDSDDDTPPFGIAIPSDEQQETR
ncbi:hypothetical protein ACWGE0_45560 [Lentzea sp. NPDC054927]